MNETSATPLKLAFFSTACNLCMQVSAKLRLSDTSATTICHIASLWYSVSQPISYITNYAGGQLMVCFDGLVVPITPCLK